MSTGERIEQALKTLGVLIAVAGFVWGVYQYFDAREREFETARVEATRPFLERQLKLYTEASQTAAVLATSKNETERGKAEKRFWELYWGELALVEDPGVEAAMVRFGRGLQSGAEPAQLQQLSLNLAGALRDSLARSWSVEHWRRGGPATGSD
jgi:hypothetical protein